MHRCFPLSSTFRNLANFLRTSSVGILCGLLWIVPGLAAETPGSSEASSLDLPWREAGLDAHQAAAHLLDRLAFGARPGDVERLVSMGLEAWVEAQLAGGIPDSVVEARLQGLHSLTLSAQQVSEVYAQPAVIARLARRQGVLEQEALVSLQAAMEDDSGLSRGEKRRLLESRRQLLVWAGEQGFRPQRELYRETILQKVLRASESENQLTEVLVDFWFNHFNVSLTDNQSRVYIPSYERDAVRPFVLGSFRQMLENTAKHPAMLHYLDNARSIAEEGQPTTLEMRLAEHRQGRRASRRGGGAGGFFAEMQQRRRRTEERPGNFQPPEGLNENYARELLELHTLGVDGGYGQQDVIEVARAFTGWTAYPPRRAEPQIEKRIARAKRYPQAGFVFEDAFIFRADAHDAAAKKVLGHSLAAGRGIEDGLEVLDLLALHPSTARHLSRKLATRFVSDTPPEALVEEIAQVYLDSRGDLRATLQALVQSPDFWSTAARQQKIKSPFELAVSALRALDAEVEDARPLVEWIGRMGQPLYAYQAPTGFPDRADAWVNTGALLNRMNFGLQLATGRIAGVQLDLLALLEGAEPESMDAALEAFVPILMPRRDAAATLQRLRPVIQDPQLLAKIEEATPTADASSFDAGWDLDGDPFGGRRGGRRGRGFGGDPPSPVAIDDSPLAQVVGVILGSPEFQRR